MDERHVGLILDGDKVVAIIPTEKESEPRSVAGASPRAQNLLENVARRVDP